MESPSTVVPLASSTLYFSTGDACLEGYIGEVALIAGAINSTPPLCRILWVLSWRRKKVPPPAGTGSQMRKNVPVVVNADPYKQARHSEDCGAIRGNPLRRLQCFGDCAPRALPRSARGQRIATSPAAPRNDAFFRGIAPQGHFLAPLGRHGCYAPSQ